MQAPVKGVRGQLAGPYPEAEVGVGCVGVSAGAIIIRGRHACDARAELQDRRALRSRHDSDEPELMMMRLPDLFIIL